MEVDNKKMDNNIFGLILTVASIFLAVLGFFVNDNESHILLLLMIALFIISILCILLKQNEIACCVILVMIFVCVSVCFEAESAPPPSVPPTTGTSSQTGEQQTDAVEPPIIDTEQTKPKETEQPMPEETEPPKPKETEEKVEINYFIYSVDNAGETAKLAISGETAGVKPQWRSSDADIVKVDSSGEITAIGSGDASIYAEIQYEGRQYYSKIEISVDLVRINTAAYTLKYLESLPDGLDQGSDQYRNMVEYHELYATEVGALASINHENYTPDEDPVKIGYVYYHWCAGDYNDPNLFVVETHKNEPAPYCYNHNRTSSYEKGPYKKSNGQIVDLNKFTCFYSEKESEYEECIDDSKCWWIDSSSICNDSYWYWKIPVYKTEYTGYDTALTITFKG